MSRERVAETIQTVNASGLATVWRNQAGSVAVRGGYMSLAPKGTPDVVGFTRGGRFVGFELKVEGDKLSATKLERRKLQAEWREKIVKAGGICEQISTPEEAIAALLSAEDLFASKGLTG